MFTVPDDIGSGGSRRSPCCNNDARNRRGHNSRPDRGIYFSLNYCRALTVNARSPHDSTVAAADMNIVEAPRISNNDAPLGTFVVLSLDPVASVADLKDEEASAAAAQLPRGKYLALVFGPDYNAFAPIHVQPLAFEFYGVGRGAPIKHPIACLGLYPQAEHPLGWDPLQPSVPLPWLDCYLHLSCHFSATVTRLHLATSTSAIPRSDLITIIRAVRLAREASEPEPSAEHDCISEEHGGSMEYSLDHSTTSLQSVGDEALVEQLEAPSHRSTVSDESRSDDLDKIPDLPPRMRPRAEIWLDLTSLDDISPPQEIIDVLVKLDAIESAWAKRAAINLLVDKPRTIQWATEVAAAELIDPESESIRGMKTGSREDENDDSVRPEDAIDYKLEAGGVVRETAAKIPGLLCPPGTDTEKRLTGSGRTENRMSRAPGMLQRLFKRAAHVALKQMGLFLRRKNLAR